MASNYNRRSSSSGSSRPANSGAPRNSRRAANSARPSVTVRQGGRFQEAGRTASAPDISSTRIGDLGQKTKERTSATKGKKRSGGKALIGFLAILLVAAIGGVFAYNSNAFTITSISVKGSDHLTSAEVNQLAGIPEGTTLLRVDAEAIKRNMLRDAWVEDVNVNRLFPSTLEIAVKERPVIAAVEISSKGTNSVRQWLIAKDRTWLMPVPDKESDAGRATAEKVFEDAENSLQIVGVPYTASAEIGVKCNDGNVNNALDIVEGMTTELADQVKMVVANDPESTTLILKNGIEIAFGDSSDIRAKERVCLELMDKYEGSVAYLNVRTVDRPTWRSL